VESSSLAALHLDRAGRFAEAAETYLDAADAASSRGAFSEALRHLGRARQLAEEELAGESGQELKRVAILRTSFVHIAKEGFGSEAATAAAAQAIELASPDSLLHSAGPRLAEFSQATILGHPNRGRDRLRPGPPRLRAGPVHLVACQLREGTRALSRGATSWGAVARVPASDEPARHRQCPADPDLLDTGGSVAIRLRGEPGGASG
jgi:hypothetical protein